MRFEVITLNHQDTKQAAQLGADRVELVSAMAEGGLTPSYGTLTRVLTTATIPVQVMIRPHSYGFVYTKTDWDIIREDIDMVRSLGGRRIVFGCTTEDGQIDEALLNKMLETADGFDITFHRAFDSLRSQQEGYVLLNKYKNQISRILTSGGEHKAKDAIPQLQQLIAKSKQLNGPTILVGSGIKPEELPNLHRELCAEEYHLGTGVRQGGNMHLPIDPEKMKMMKHYL
ncbi:copper homeostasis protein CutC [Geomicrobium sp. JCM 19039]|uniref:copper homeostasis protein CutC n=1 Tax=Geomicrobium sp. JCM 19039 TaxID=1460636 RepID=UPI00045F1868|nr:copper homeostasis protein CutC [Geomicrobium sp. JCM 19039]GAK11690.1 cytoplasmic copper homeostasis protein CutC [Geomicrobium sp. JCM 19039]